MVVRERAAHPPSLELRSPQGSARSRSRSSAENNRPFKKWNAERLEIGPCCRESTAMPGSRESSSRAAVAASQERPQANNARGIFARIFIGSPLHDAGRSKYVFERELQFTHVRLRAG